MLVCSCSFLDLEFGIATRDGYGTEVHDLHCDGRWPWAPAWFSSKLVGCLCGMFNCDKHRLMGLSALNQELAEEAMAGNGHRPNTLVWDMLAGRR